MAAGSGWESLPSIITVEIFAYLELTDRLNASLTCRRWRTFLFHPVLWKSIKLKLKYGNRKSSKFLAEICGRFVREAAVEFTSQNIHDLNECLNILKTFACNRNLEKLVLKPSSCLIAWPGRQNADLRDLYIDTFEDIIRNSRRIKHLSLGCMGELADHANELLNLLKNHHSSNLEALHISSVKENPYSYGIIYLPVHAFRSFRNLRILGIDYDYLTNELLDGFIVGGGKTCLEKMVLHVHGVDDQHEKITNRAWMRLVQANPSFEVTINLIHSLDGSVRMLDILQPALPLAHVRMLFCQQINMTAVNFIARHMAGRLRSIYIVDGMEDGQPNLYELTTDEDPFVMLAWKCPNLTNFTLIGYDICEDDVVAIARLRGSQLSQLSVPLCCISQPVDATEEELTEGNLYGLISPEFTDEVSLSLGRTWHPVLDNHLHPAVLDPLADAETAYLSMLLADQE